MSSLTTSRSSDAPTALATASVFRPVATTAWPAARAALAKSMPMPRLAPVINQTLLILLPPVSRPLLFPKPLEPVRQLRPPFSSDRSRRPAPGPLLLLQDLHRERVRSGAPRATLLSQPSPLRGPDPIAPPCYSGETSRDLEDIGTPVPSGEQRCKTRFWR